MRTSVFKTINNLELFKKQLLFWANNHREVIFLDSNSYPQKQSNFSFLMAVDAFTSIKTDYYNAFEDLKQYQSQTRDWLFGYLSYDLKNNIEDLQSNNFDGLKFPDLFFFQPKKIFLFKENVLEIKYLNLCDDEIDFDFDEINAIKFDNEIESDKIEIQQRISKEQYFRKTYQFLKHINRGDIYEANFCQEFFAENTTINTLDIYNKLNQISEPPFAVYFKNYTNYLISASPERYLCKNDTTVISQPIKGTSKKFVDKIEDDKSKNDLLTNKKERSENIMIVDLVRNDLSQTAEKGSVVVTELCELYTFKQVHHLVSTIISAVSHTTSPIEILKTTYPMGSMTGAPKISAMRIIENLEETKRGLYSGAVGYFEPNGDFDFNVVIRSILYNSEEKYVSFSVGSAITSLSVPEKEYEECLLKAQAMIDVLTQ